MNLSKKLKNLKGEDYSKSFPNRKEMEKLGKDKEGNYKVDKLERETIGNVIINCLTMYRCENKKEGFYVNAIAQSIISGDKEIKLKDKFVKFLVEILEDSIMKKPTKNSKGEEIQEGLYAGWVIAQVLQELGIKEEL